jgi:hypothetical protein
MNATAATCPAGTCAFDGTRCVHSRAFLLALAGVAQGNPAFAAARSCAAATTRDACGSLGAQVPVSKEAIAFLRASDVASAAGVVAATLPAISGGARSTGGAAAGALAAATALVLLVVAA